MKKAAGCAGLLVLALFVSLIVAVPVACLATLTAPLHSPAYAAKIFCPAGSQLQSEWYQSTHEEPGQRSLSVVCVDAEGQTVPRNPLDEQTLLNGIVLYFPVCFVPLLALGVIIVAVVFLAADRIVRAIRPKTAAPGI